VVPAGALAVGIPASVRSGVPSAERIWASADLYVENARRYRSILRRIG
jgi:hypothetical protein